MRQTIRMTVMVWALGTGLTAQQGEPQSEAAKQLARAVVIEELEHDVGAAIEIYREIAASEAAAEAVRAQAALRLGMALRAIGQNQEAAHALTAAARDPGDVGRRARAALQDPQGDEKLEARVGKGLSVLSGHSVDTTGAYDLESATKEMIWIGAPAVPHLVRAAEAPEADLEFIERASRVLMQIGGPDVVAWLERVAKQADGLTKRRVVRAFKPNVVSARGVRDALCAWARDSDPLVRADALQMLYTVLPARDVIALAGDPDPRVREAAFMLIGSHWEQLQHLEGNAASVERLLPHLDRALREPDSSIGRRVLVILQLSPVLQSSGGRSLFLRAIPLPAFHSAQVNDSWRNGPAEHVDEIVALARRLGPVQPRQQRERRETDATPPQRLLGVFIARCSGSWTREALPGVLELVSLGYGLVAYLDNFVVHTATAADVAAVVERVGSFHDGVRICQWLADKQLSSDALPVLTAWARAELLAPLLASTDEQSRSHYLALLALVSQPIGRLASPEATAFLEELAGSGAAYSAAVEGLLAGQGAEVTAARKRVLVLDVAGAYVPNWRNRLFHRLLQEGNREADYAGAYRLGLEENRRGLHYWNAKPWSPAWDGPALARVVDSCLTTRLPLVWVDIDRLGDGRRRGLPPEFYTVLCRRIEECPEQRPDRSDAMRRDLRRWLVQACWGVPGHREMLLGALAEPEVGRDVVQRLGGVGALDAEIVEALLPYLEDPNPSVVTHTLYALRRTGDPGLVPRLRPLLAHGESSVQRTAADTLMVLAPDRARDWIAPLARDEDRNTRAYFCAKAEALVDRTLVPDLLRLLRDPDESVRGHAAAALQAIEFYDEQNRRWNRILAASGLDATDAAEALIRKARQGDQAIRLAAIASLGTLGVAETLPFLLELMSDADPEIAAAARAALQKINAGGTGVK